MRTAGLLLNPWINIRGLPRSIWILFATILINRAGSMVVPFLVLYLTRDRGLSADGAGFIFSLFGIGALVASPLAGRLSDRFGPLPVMKASLFGAGVVMFAYPSIRSEAGLIPMTLALSVMNEAFRPAGLALVADLVPAEKRKAAFAAIRLANNLGMSVGPAAGGFLAGVSFELLFRIDAATSILAALFLFASRMKPAREGSAGLGGEAPATSERSARADSPGPRAYANPSFLYFLSSLFVIAVVFFQHEGAMALYLVRDLHQPESAYGLLFSINTVLIVFLEVPLNGWTADWPTRRVLTLGSLLFAVGFGALDFARGFWSTALTVVVWTFGEMMAVPAMAAYVADIAPDARRGEYMGLYTMTFGLAFAFGPWIGISVLDRFGSDAVWSGAFLVGVLGAAMMARVAPARRTSEAE